MEWHQCTVNERERSLWLSLQLQFVSVSTFLQEGFILGESKIEEQVTINDSQADHIHIEEIYSELYLDTLKIRSLPHDKTSFFLPLK